MKTNVKNFKGARLKELIKINQMTQEEFAEKFCVSTQTVSSWITEKKKPSSYNLEMLSEFFDVPQECFTNGFPLCSKAEYQSYIERIQKEIIKFSLYPTDDSLKVLYNYLCILGSRYKTFDIDVLDKGVLKNSSVFHLIKKNIENTIEELFIEFGVIKAKELYDNDKE